MHRLFLDANILFSSAYEEDSPFLAFWEMSGVTLLSSHYAVGEARRNLDAMGITRLDQLIATMEIIFIFPPVTLPPSVTLPDKDVPILQAAIAAKSTHLLTGDRSHFGCYYDTEIEGVLILPPATYLKRWKASH